MSDYKIIANDTDIDVSYNEPSISAYNLTADVIRMTETITAHGQTEVAVTLVNLMPCSIDWKNITEKTKFNKQTLYIDGILNCRKPSDTILPSDKIYYNSEYYEIAGIMDVNNLGVLLQIAIRKVK